MEKFKITYKNEQNEQVTEIVQFQNTFGKMQCGPTIRYIHTSALEWADQYIYNKINSLDYVIEPIKECRALVVRENND